MKTLGRIATFALVVWIGSYVALRMFAVDKRPTLNKVLNIVDVVYLEVPGFMTDIVGIYGPLVALDEKLSGKKIKLATPVKVRGGNQE